MKLQLIVALRRLGKLREQRERRRITAERAHLETLRTTAADLITAQIDLVTSLEAGSADRRRKTSPSAGTIVRTVERRLKAPILIG